MDYIGEVEALIGLVSPQVPETNEENIFTLYK